MPKDSATIRVDLLKHHFEVDSLDNAETTKSKERRKNLLLRMKYS
jgi:hypothetical protein